VMSSNAESASPCSSRSASTRSARAFARAVASSDEPSAQAGTTLVTKPLSLGRVASIHRQSSDDEKSWLSSYGRGSVQNRQISCLPMLLSSSARTQPVREY
jgi:hypothetical protein